MVRLDRQKLLSDLSQLKPAVTRTDTFAQSSCLCFVGDRVVAMGGKNNNDQLTVACSLPSPLAGEVSGAVPARKLYELLAAMRCEEVRISQANGHLTVQPGEKKKGEREAARIDVSMEVELPVHLLPSPTEWKLLDSAFCDALEFISEFGKGKKGATATYVHMVHLHPDYLEAIDGVQCARWPLRNDITSCVCLTEDILPAARLKVKECAENDRWVSFRNSEGLVYSCRKEEAADYPNLDGVLHVEGTKVVFPKGLTESVSIGEVFAKIDDTHNNLLLHLHPGKFTLTGYGPQGEYTREVDGDYDGPEVEVYVNATRLKGLADRHSECVVSESKLRVDTQDYHYVSVLVPRSALDGEQK